jgi:amino acid adenylation domain-containing protein
MGGKLSKADIEIRRRMLSPEKQLLLDSRLRGTAPIQVERKIRRRSLQNVVPLSYAQERLWLLEQMGGLGSAYNMPALVRLRGELNVGALERSFAAVVDRHEALRTRFVVEDGSPVQVIDPPDRFGLQVEDLSEVAAGDRAGVARERLQALAQQPFDLERGGLFRAHLLRLSAQEHIAVVVMHHIVSDGWSIGVLIREVGALYAAYSGGLSSPLPALPVQYADYALWQRGWLQGEVLERQVAYWKERLSGAPAALQLPTDRPRPAVQSYRGAQQGFALSQELSDGLRALARSEGATLFMVLLAAFQVVLSRWSGQTDVVVGSPIAGRTHREVEGLVGFFVNTLALRTDLSGDPGFRELLGDVRETALGAYAHQDLPFEKLVEELNPVRDLSRQPVFQVLLALQNVAQETLSLPGLRLSQVGGEAVTAKLDLALYVHETERGVQGYFEYATDLFDGATIERLAGHLRVLLEGIVAAPDARLSALPLLSAAERHRLVVEWNDTAAEYPREKCVHELFVAQATRSPDAVAVVYEDNALTYGELDRRSNRLAHYLRGLGVGLEVIVGLCVDRSLEMVIGLLGILKAGGAYLPLDPSYPGERLAYMAADAKAAVLVTQAELEEGLPTDDMRVVCLDADRAEIAACQDSIPNSGSQPDNLAYVIYTSGSTGQPKGAMGTHRNASKRLSWDVSLAGEGKIYCQKTSPHFLDAYWEVFMPLLRGGKTLVVPYEVARDPWTLRRVLTVHQVDRLALVPSMLHSILALSVDTAFQWPQLRVCMIGGEAVPVDLAEAFRLRLPEALLLNVYGMSETWDATWYDARRFADQRSIPIGRPLSNTRVYVLEGGLSPVPIGVGGELYIGGVGLARGYVGRAGLTGERFVPSPYGDGERLYRTGDVVRWHADGNLEFLGRVDHQVKVRGYRIELGEIEARLVEHPAVGQAVVVAREDEPGDKRLVAYVVPSGEGVEAATLRAHLQRSLPEYMVPSAYVVLEALPLTPNGKVDRRALPAPEGDAVVRGEYVAPRTPSEEVLAAIWCEVLKLDRVGVDDNFFKLGGHSLLAMRVIARVREEFEVDLPLRSLFETPGVRELARRVEAAQRDGLGLAVPSLRVGLRPDVLPLSHAQERLWLLEQMGGLGSAYHIPAAVRLRGELDVGALERAFATVVERHEVLRTRFVVEDGNPVQVVDPPGLSGLAIEDLSDVPKGERATTARERVNALTQQRFDFERGPLFRAYLLRLSADEHVAVVVMHHIVSDGWSIGVLIREVSALYAAYSGRLSSPLPALPVQYADYALWQRGWLRGEALERQVAYWKERLAGAPAALQLPTDRPRPAVQSYGGAHHSFALPAELAAQLHGLARSEGATLFMVLLAAFNVVLWRWSGQADIVVGSPIAGRTHRELEGLIGFFVNTLALRTDLSGDPSFKQLLQRVKQTALGAYGHQDLPFEKLVAELQPVRDLSRQPIFQVLFALQNVPQEMLQLPGLQLRWAGRQQATAKFDLSLHVNEGAPGLQGYFEYATDLFDGSTIARLAGHLKTLLEGIVANPDARIGDLPLLAESARRQLLVEWNDTAAAYPRDKCVHDLFVEQAARTPDAVALVYEDSALSYGELDRRSNRLAHYLRGLGVGPEVIVGLCVERSLEMVMGLLGILKAGGAYLPLDPSYPSERLAYMLADARAPVVVTQAGLVAQLPAHEARVVRIDADWREVAEQTATLPVSEARPENPGYLLYTSGSTGRPKGVVVEHRQVVNYLWSISDGADLTGVASYMMVQPLSVDSSVTVLFASLLRGGILHVIGYDAGLDGQWLADYASRHAIDCLKIAPPHLQSLMACEHGAKILPTKRLIVGGDVSHWEWIEGLRRLSPRCRIFNHYGPTEATVGVTTYPVDDAGERGMTGGVPIGRPLNNTQLYILDPRLEPTAVGVVGELYIGGAPIARGYFGRPGQTAECFIPDPFARGGAERLYRSGDRARYLPDGNIEFLGRYDQQVKVRGYRIELDEIANVLQEHPAVGQAVVIAPERTDQEERSDQERSVVAYVVLADRLSVESSELRRYVAGKLPGYMVPASVVVLEALPRTPHGKVDRRALPAPQGDRVVGGAYKAPRTPSEEVLAAIWCEVLKLDRVGVDDNFFELGGHSLLAIRVLELMRREGLHCSVRALFTTPTIAALATAASRDGELVEVPPNRIAPGCDAITPEMLPLVTLAQAEIDRIVAAVPGGAANVQDIYPLAPLQEGILFHHLLESAGDPYLSELVLSFDSCVGLDAYVRALQAVIDRHDILRTTVVWEGLSEPVQVVWRRARLVVLEVALDAAAGAAAGQLRRRFDQRRYRLDVRQAPLLGVFVAHDAARDRWLLLQLSHHLTIDHTTLEILIEEVRAHVLGQAERLAAAVPFRNFVAQARLGVSAQEHATFFRAMLGDVEEPTVPFGLTNVYGDGTGIGEARRAVDEAVARRLRLLARALGVSAASLFHLAFAQVLARLSGRDDVVFGTVLFGRLQGGVGADRAVGLLMNTLPVRLRVGAGGVRDSVWHTHRLLTDLLRHEHASLVLAQRCSGVMPSMPLFSALLNYRHSAPTRPDSVAVPGWKGIRLLEVKERNNYPLTLSVDDLGEGFVLTAQVQSRFDPDRLCGFMQRALEQLSNALERHPAARLCDLDVLPESERRQLVEEWNATAAAYPKDCCIHDLFVEQAARTPDAVALVYEESALSYGELDRRSSQLAHHLRALGVGPEVVVGLCVERSLEMVVGVLGILKAGGAYLPLDPSYPTDRLAYMLKDAQAAVVVTRAGLEDMRAHHRGAVVRLDADWKEIAAHPNDPPDTGVCPENLCYVIYTSGSTGKPKGVMGAHRVAVGRLDWDICSQEASENEVYAQKTSLAFIDSVWELFMPLSRGQRLALIADRIVKDPSALVLALGDLKVTRLLLVPSLLAAILEMEPPPAARLRQLRYWQSEGEPLSTSLAELFRARLPDASLINVYGMSECFDATRYDAAIGAGLHGVPSGRPIANARVYVLDGNLDLVPIGVVGEIHIGGIGLARGYLNRPGLTAERFIPNPFGRGERICRTGDLGLWRQNGNLEHLGRVDHQVKVRGYRIELGEVEARLVEHAAVGQAVVVAREYEAGDKRLVAYVVAADAAVIDAGELRAHLKQSLPEYMVPSAYVVLEALPLTPNGKVDRKALPAPESDAVVRGEYVAPRTPTEEVLAAIWCEVLRLDRVGVDDNFFELGGHSLLAMRVILRVRDEFQIGMPIRVVFEAPRIARLAEWIETAKQNVSTIIIESGFGFKVGTLSPAD